MEHALLPRSTSGFAQSSCAKKQTRVLDTEHSQRFIISYTHQGKTRSLSTHHFNVWQS